MLPPIYLDEMLAGQAERKVESSLVPWIMHRFGMVMG